MPKRKRSKDEEEEEPDTTSTGKEVDTNASQEEEKVKSISKSSKEKKTKAKPKSDEKDSKKTKKQTTLTFAAKSKSSSSSEQTTKSTEEDANIIHDTPSLPSNSNTTTTQSEQPTETSNKQDTPVITLDETEEEEQQQPVVETKKKKPKKKKSKEEDDFIVDSDEEPEPKKKTPKKKKTTAAAIDLEEEQPSKKTKPSTKKSKSNSTSFCIPHFYQPHYNTSSIISIPSPPESTYSISPNKSSLPPPLQLAQEKETISIPHLTSHSIPCKQKDAQLHILNVGGNTFQAMDWLHNYFQQDNSTYLAVALKPTISSQSKLHQIRRDQFLGHSSKEEEEVFFIQIWNCTTSIHLELQMEISHAFAWNLKWMKHVQFANSNSYIGILSVVLSNGKVECYAIPKIEEKGQTIRLPCFCSYSIPLLSTDKNKMYQSDIIHSTSSSNDYKYKCITVNEEEEEGVEQEESNSKIQYPNQFTSLLLCYAMQWSPNQQLLATGGHDGSIQIWKMNPHSLNASFLTLLLHCRGHYTPTRSCCIRQLTWYNNEQFLSVANDGHVKGWNVNELLFGNHCIFDRHVCKYWVTDVCFPSLDQSNAFLLSTHEGQIKQFQIKEDGFSAIVSLGNTNPIWSVNVNASSGILCYGTTNGTIGVHSLMKNHGLASGRSFKPQHIRNLIQVHCKEENTLEVKSCLLHSKMEEEEEEIPSYQYNNSFTKVLFHPFDSNLCVASHSQCVILFRIPNTIT